MEENLGKLLNLSTISDPYLYLNEVIKLLGLIFNADQISIYQAVEDFPILKSIVPQTGKQNLPETLSFSEFGQLESVGLWFPGKPIMADIQKRARESQLSYLANAVLGEEEAAFGLIVVGSSTHEPIKNIKIHLSFIARIVTATLHAGNSGE